MGAAQHITRPANGGVGASMSQLANGSSKAHAPRSNRISSSVEPVW